MSELEPILAGGPLRLDREGEKGVRVTMTKQSRGLPEQGRQESFKEEVRPDQELEGCGLHVRGRVFQGERKTGRKDPAVGTQGQPMPRPSGTHVQSCYSRGGERETTGAEAGWWDAARPWGQEGLRVLQGVSHLQVVLQKITPDHMKGEWLGK